MQPTTRNSITAAAMSIFHVMELANDIGWKRHVLRPRYALNRGTSFDRTVSADTLSRRFAPEVYRFVRARGERRVPVGIDYPFAVLYVVSRWAYAFVRRRHIVTGYHTRSTRRAVVYAVKHFLASRRFEHPCSRRMQRRLRPRRLRPPQYREASGAVPGEAVRRLRGGDRSALELL